MIHSFLDAPKLMDYENIMNSIALSQKNYLLGLF